MRLYLTGFMGSGKSTVGRLLAEKTGIPFIDLDQEIEQKLSSSIAEIFESHGEFYFRDQERELLHRIETDPVVVATGGGCFIQNSEWMKRNGIVIFLDVPFESLLHRLGADAARPLWKNAKKLYEERYDQYRQAHYLIEASGNPEEVTERIRGLLLPELEKIPEN